MLISFRKYRNLGVLSGQAQQPVGEAWMERVSPARYQPKGIITVPMLVSSTCFQMVGLLVV